MAFLNKLGEKMRETAKETAEKTKNMAETVRLNGLISDEKKRINSYFLEIGKVYFEKYLDNPDASIISLVSQVIDAESKIADYSAQIKQLKGTVTCENCKAEVSPDKPFCSECGSSIETLPANISNDAEKGESDMKCKNCGAAIFTLIKTKFTNNRGGSYGKDQIRHHNQTFRRSVIFYWACGTHAFSDSCRICAYY